MLGAPGFLRPRLCPLTLGGGWVVPTAVSALVSCCLQVRAKAIRKYVDKMITLAKEGSLHSRRQVRPGSGGWVGGLRQVGSAQCWSSTQCQQPVSQSRPAYRTHPEASLVFCGWGTGTAGEVCSLGWALGGGVWGPVGRSSMQGEGALYFMGEQVHELGKRLQGSGSNAAAVGAAGAVVCVRPRDCQVAV